MEQDNIPGNRLNNRNDRFWTGFILIIIGGVLLVEKLGVPLPYWLFTWPMILILIGVVSGLKHGFRNFSWLIMISIGGFFLADDIIPYFDAKHYFWPIMIMALGLLFILRPKKKWRCERHRWRGIGDDPINSTNSYEATSGDDKLNSASIFGGVKKIVTSKNFNGGEIFCFMGGAEINLSQADITGPVSIEIIQLFGGTKLIVPPHWEIRTEAIAIFAGVEDKRPPQPGTFDPNKILILKGTTVFGGIEIKSY